MTKGSNEGSEAIPGRAEMGLRNLRDVGGLAVAGGGRVRAGLVYRSEAPVGLEAVQMDALREVGLRKSLDLRDEETEDVFAATTLPAGVERLVVAITPPADADGKGLLQQLYDGELRDYPASRLGELYVDLLDKNRPQFARGIGYLSDPENLPVLIHCHAGKDRTGLLVAMLLDLLGVPVARIVEEYEVTSAMRAHRREEVEPTLARHGIEWDQVSAMFLAPAEALEVSFEWVAERFGSFEGYLTGPDGISAATIGRLRANLVESSG